MSAAAGLRERRKVFVTEPDVAEIVAAVAEETAATVALKLVEVEPAAIVTVAGSVTEAVLLESATATTPAGAAAVRETVQLSLPEVA